MEEHPLVAALLEAEELPHRVPRRAQDRQRLVGAEPSFFTIWLLGILAILVAAHLYFSRF